MYLFYHFDFEEYDQDKYISAMRLIDTDNDGQLEKYEVYYYFWSIVDNQDLAMGIADEIFDEVDLNENGFIEHTEFLFGTIDNQNLVKSENLEGLFGIIDLNNDGKICSGEIEKFFGLESENEFLEEIMVEIGNGFVDKQNF